MSNYRSHSWNGPAIVYRAVVQFTHKDSDHEPDDKALAITRHCIRRLFGNADMELTGLQVGYECKCVNEDDEEGDEKDFCSQCSQVLHKPECMQK